ncbi:MAG TPA: TIGR01244 family sulfur transferase [Allosphingosinicella sp.]|nr:TIGR01244 family sulfur transferase [Allosphingosinicella sp.]
MRHLDNKTLVAGQILPSQMGDIAASGVTMVVNNRPDGEEPGQPAAAEIEAAARAAGLGYAHIPIAEGMKSEDVVAMMDAMIEAGEGKLLAFCKSGTRSTFLWALTRRQQGVPADEIVSSAAGAGYELNLS